MISRVWASTSTVFPASMALLMIALAMIVLPAPVGRYDDDAALAG